MLQKGDGWTFFKTDTELPVLTVDWRLSMGNHFFVCSIFSGSDVLLLAMNVEVSLFLCYTFSLARAGTWNCKF
jgi:hypothetical protein